MRTAHSINRTGMCRVHDAHLTAANEAADTRGDLTAADLAEIDAEFGIVPRSPLPADHEERQAALRAQEAALGMDEDFFRRADAVTGQQRREAFEQRTQRFEDRERTAAERVGVL